MKKFLLILSAVTVLLAGCAKDEAGSETGTGEMVKASFTAVMQGTPQTKTVTDGKGTKANRCVMEIYYQGVLYQREVKSVSDMKATFTPKLASNRTYDVLFWADCGEGLDDKYYKTDAEGGLRAVEMKAMSYKANEDARDAFFVKEQVEVHQQVSSKTFELKRPFAQVNIITTDAGIIKNDNLYPDGVKMVYKAPTKFNLLTGELSKEEKLTVTGVPYETFNKASTALTLAMDYLFTDASVLNIEFEASKTGETTVTKHSFTNIPVKRNYRTNIKGALLTTTGQWTAEIEPKWSTPAYDVPYYVASSITDAQNYISTPNTEQTKVVDLSKAEIKQADVNEDGTIHFILKTTSPKDLVNFTLPAIPEDIENCHGWTIRYEENYPTKNVGVNAPANTKVKILAPTSHVNVTGTTYAEIEALTGDETLVIPQGVTVASLIIKKGAVEIHGTVNTLTVNPDEGKKVVFRACEGLSATVFEKIYKEGSVNYIDPMYTYTKVGEKYDIYKLPVVAMIGEKEYPSIAAAVAAAVENDVIDVVAESVELPALNKAGITVKGNGTTKVTKFGGLSGKNVTLDGFEFTVETNPSGENFVIKNSKFTGTNGLRYAYAKGNVLIENCVFDTKTYGIHFDGTRPGKATVKNCQIVGFNTFNPELSFVNCNFVDSDKNMYYVAQSWSNVTFTGCTFSEKWCDTAGAQTIGLTTKTGLAEISNCTFATGTVYDACKNSELGVIAIDATGNATDGFTAGTFVAKQASDIKVSDLYEAVPVEGKENVFAIAPKTFPEDVVTVCNGVGYKTLQDAFNAARTAMGGTITLVSDVVLTKTISWNGIDGFWTGADDSKRQHGDGTVTDCSNKYIFDLNGYHVTSQEGKNCKIEVRGCEFNIKDSKGDGYISNPNGFAFYLGSEREPHYNNCGVLNISGGTFKGKNDNPCSAFGHVYSIGTDGTTNDNHVNAKIINIYGGEFEGLSCDEVKVNIYGGHFTSYIYKGKRNDTNEYLDGKENDAIFVYGGKFDITGWKTQTLEPYKFDMVEITNDLLHIYAGDFNLDPTAYVMEGSKVEKVGDRWIVTQNN